MHLSYKLSKLNELQLSYSRRVRRPDGEDLNPFPEYRDPLNVWAGNPKLLPEYVNVLELGCQYLNGGLMLVPALFYRNTNNRFTRVTQTLHDSIVLTTMENLASDQSGGIELNVSWNHQKSFSLHGYSSVFFDQIDATNLNNTMERRMLRRGPAISRWMSI